MAQEAELTRGAVLSAVKEFKRLGRKAFLERYGFGGARDYFLVVDGENYDSKAILGAAHQYLNGGRALTHSELSGGLADTVRKLEKLGFEIATPGENADWTWDEHVLALDLYLRFPNSPPGKNSAPVRELSDLLIAMGKKSGVQMTPKFRNANGVYKKLMNFRAIDPAIQAQGKIGLSHGAAGEKRVWEAYFGKPEALRERVAAIRAALADESVSLAGLDEESDYEAEEGGIVLRYHKARERKPELARKKKRAAMQKFGCLACEVCEFDFSAAYGPIGLGFIEAHHRKPVAALGNGGKTKVSDLALVCANCHRMLHKSGLISVEELKLRLQSRQASA